METRTRSVVTAGLWTLIGIVCTIIVGLIRTGSAVIGSTIALVNAVVGGVFYVVYERLWDRVARGRIGASHG